MSADTTCMEVEELLYDERIKNPLYYTMVATRRRWDEHVDYHKDLNVVRQGFMLPGSDVSHQVAMLFDESGAYLHHEPHR